MLRGRAPVIALFVLLVAIGALFWRRSQRGPAPVVARTSVWVPPRPHQRPPKLLPAAALPPALEHQRGDLLVVHVEDVLGGAIAGAEVSRKQVVLGITDQAGVARLAQAALGLPRSDRLEVAADGYARRSASYVSPGEVRVQLLPGGSLSGVVVEKGSDRPVPGLTVVAEQATTISDAQGRFTLRDLAAGTYPLQARGPAHFGALPAPVAVGLGRAVAGVRLEVTRACKG
jgi:hypothetical protein